MTVAAIDRCLALLELLAGQPEGLELGVIAERLGLPKSATHRLLASLMTRRWVVRAADGEAYALSLHLATLAFRTLDATGLPDAAQGVLDALAERTGEYCRLALVEGEDLVWVARAQGATGGLRYEPPMGRPVVLHATATGKAWLATLPENTALMIACARGLDGGGPRAVTTVEALKRNLDETRRRGFAVAEEEAEAGTVAIAMAFQAGEGDDRTLGTVSVAGPTVRMPRERYGEIAKHLRSAALDLGRIWPVRKRQMAVVR